MLYKIALGGEIINYTADSDAAAWTIAAAELEAKPRLFSWSQETGEFRSVPHPKTQQKNLTEKQSRVLGFAKMVVQSDHKITPQALLKHDRPHCYHTSAEPLTEGELSTILAELCELGRLRKTDDDEHKIVWLPEG